MNKLQQFLSLMDTIHDYGNTSRTTKAIFSRNDDPDNDIDDEDEVQTLSFNKAFLLDFLMLALLQQNFKDIIGLSTKQHYLINRKDCLSSKIFDALSAHEICYQFYYPTYEDNIVFRSPKPEKKTKDILFSTKMLPNNNNEIEITSFLDKSVVDFENNIVIKHNSFPTKDELIRTVQNVIQMVLESDNLHFILDANCLDNKIFDSRVLTGLFVNFDAAPTGNKTQENNNAPLKDLEGLDFESQKKRDNDLKYVLTKADGELVLFDELGAWVESVYGIYYRFKNITYRVNLMKENNAFAKGLSLFVQLINAINEKTLGVQKLGPKTKDELQGRLERLGLQIILKKYSIYLEMYKNVTDESERDSILFLERCDFIMALFDLKRAMDYLYVKACFEANRKDQKQSRKYVFVSSDKCAIYYALSLGCPCILTSPMTTKGSRKGEQVMTIYNPDKHTIAQAPIIKSESELEALLQDIINKEKQYEMEDEIEFLINQLTVNKASIEKKLQEACKNKKTNSNRFKDLQRIYAQFDDAFDSLYDLKFNAEKETNLAQEAFKQEIAVQQEKVAATSPYKKPQRPPQIAKELPNNAQKSNEENIEEAIKTIKNENFVNFEELMDKYLSKNKNICAKWLIDLADYTKGVTSSMPLPRGFKKIKTDKQNQNDLIEKIKKYCFIKHKLEGFFNEQLNSKTGGDGNGLPDLSSVQRRVIQIDPKETMTKLENTMNSYNEKDHKRKINKILDHDIPLAFDANASSVFDNFLNAYSALSPTISFFWYIVFKTICFHIEK